jgi:hypothetical protein
MKNFIKPCYFDKIMKTEHRFLSIVTLVILLFGVTELQAPSVDAQSETTISSLEMMAKNNSMSAFNSNAYNNTSTFSNVTKAMINAFGEPFYILGDSLDTGSSVTSIDPMKTKDSFSANGTMHGVGAVTQQATFESTHSPKLSSEGLGIITTPDGYATTFTAKDIGYTGVNGTVYYYGVMNFSSHPEGKFGFLNDRMGLYLYQEDHHGRDSTRAWLWG